ncbi:glycosyltransferase family protein 64 [Canna indica]|uniref:Glycosyltransferase family protein 64 n=1 Tax=Canna indica TaxID=4628 RepID=A0AAQ3K8B2_9LILI|nr:glycosyltransferase family protein 64 [Canna indica]
MWWEPPRFLLQSFLFHLISSLLFSDSYSDACDPRSMATRRPPVPTIALASLAFNDGVGSAPISIIRQSSASLNACFLPRIAIRTRIIAVCDDDVEVDARTLAFAFSVWGSHGGASLAGLFACSHDLDLEHRCWIDAMHPDR